MPRLNDTTYSYDTKIKLMGFELHFHKPIPPTGYDLTEDEEIQNQVEIAVRFIWRSFEYTFPTRSK